MVSRSINYNKLYIIVKTFYLDYSRRNELLVDFLPDIAYTIQMEAILVLPILFKAGEDIYSSRQAHAESIEDPWLFCRACGNPVTQQKNRILHNSRHEWQFSNPSGYMFTIQCFDTAPGCMPAGSPEDFFTWFPGYAWQPGHCSQCEIHLGWKFSNADDSFFGIIKEALSRH